MESEGRSVCGSSMIAVDNMSRGVTPLKAVASKGVLGSSSSKYLEAPNLAKSLAVHLDRIPRNSKGSSRSVLQRERAWNPYFRDVNASFEWRTQLSQMNLPGLKQRPRYRSREDLRLREYACSKALLRKEKDWDSHVYPLSAQFAAQHRAFRGF